MYRLKLHLHGTEVEELALESGREYTFGRGNNCDVVLEGRAGISRTHFKLFEENGQWTVQVIAKFGDINYGGQGVSHLPLEPGHVFKLGGYDFKFMEAAQAQAEDVFVSQEEELPMAVGQSEAAPMNVPSTASVVETLPAPISDFEGNDEATRVVTVVGGVPHLRIVDPSGEEELIKLEGRQWTAGRDQTNEIVLNHPKASRRQFELSTTPQGYFIRDLGSSNGTTLNGTLLGKDAPPHPLQSGDSIAVGSLSIFFEIRDPSFEKKLMVVPQEILSPPNSSLPMPYEMINYPVASGPGGAIRLHQTGDGGLAPYEQPWGMDPTAAKKKNKIRFYLIVGAILLPLLVWLSNSPTPPPPKPTVQVTDPFSKLSPSQQQIVKETYILARNLLTQGKHALAADQLKKLHGILPEGYEDSLAMDATCRSQAEQEEQLKFIEAQRKKEEENRRIVEANLRDCEPVASRSMNPEEVRACLAPTYELDPSNPRVDMLISQVQRRLDERNMKIAAQRDYEERVSKGRSLYFKAEELDKSGKAYEAVQAYKQHIASVYPDPGNLKSKSQQNMLVITQQVAAKVDDAVASAESAYASGNYKGAIDFIKRAKEMDATNARAATLNAKIQRELAIKLKEIYEESIIAEGLGNVPVAKEYWKKIIDIDHPEGEYYRKAKSKLRAYGAM